VSKEISIEIDDKPYVSNDDQQEASGLLLLAGRDPKAWDLAVVEPHGIDHFVKDNDLIELKNGMRFVTREKLHYTVDGERFTTHDDKQDAAAIMREAGVDPSRFDLTRDNGDGTFETFKDGQLVTIKNGDKFVTAKQDGGVA
jgi:hypothetical protein